MAARRRSVLTLQIIGCEGFEAEAGNGAREGALADPRLPPTGKDSEIARAFAHLGADLRFMPFRKPGSRGAGSEWVHARLDEERGAELPIAFRGRCCATRPTRAGACGTARAGSSGAELQARVANRDEEMDRARLAEPDR
jgi:hypothetical protein